MLAPSSYCIQDAQILLAWVRRNNNPLVKTFQKLQNVVILMTSFSSFEYQVDDSFFPLLLLLHWSAKLHSFILATSDDCNWLGYFSVAHFSSKWNMNFLKYKPWRLPTTHQLSTHLQHSREDIVQWQSHGKYFADLFKPEPIGSSPPKLTSESDGQKIRRKSGAPFAFLCPAQASPVPSFRYYIAL